MEKPQTKRTDRFHPGSLDSSTDKDTLLDLAKRAARFHVISPVQEIKLDQPIWEPCSYEKAISILTSEKLKQSKENLVPKIVPKMKLVARKTLKDAGNDHLRGTNIIKIAARGKDSEKAFSEAVGNAGLETQRGIKEEKMEEPTEGKPSGETILSCHNTIQGAGMEMEEKSGVNSKKVLTELKSCMHKEDEIKRLLSISEKSQDTETEIIHKRQRLSSKQDATGEEPKDLPSNRAATEKGDGGKPCCDTAKNEASSCQFYRQADRLWQYVKRERRDPVVGLDALLECHCDQREPIYLCQCCALRFPERNIVGHVTGTAHQKTYLMRFLKLPRPPGMQAGMTFRHWAALYELHNGHGEAQVVDVDENFYNKVFSIQNFQSALHTVKALQAQQEHLLELPLTSDVLSVQHVDTSVPLCAQHEVYSDMDNYQIDGSDDCETQQPSISTAVSVMTDSSSRTSEVSRESNVNVKITQIKESESASKSSNSTPTSTTSSCTSARGKFKETAKSTAVGEASSSTAPSSKLENSSKTVDVPRSSVAAAIMANCGNTEATARTAETSNSIDSHAKVAKHVRKRDTLAASNPIKLKSVTSDAKNQLVESSFTSVNKTTPSPKLGVDQLIIVSCKRRRQIYCKMCSVRLSDSSHLNSFKHLLNLMKLFHPTWNLIPSELESKKEWLVDHLSEMEEEIGPRFSQRIELKIDEYTCLSSLTHKGALERLKAMLGQKDLRVSSSTSDTPEALKRQLAVTSPCEVSSPVNAKQDNLELEKNSEAPVEVIPANENSGVKGQKAQDCAEPLSSDSEPSGPCPKSPDGCQEAAGQRQLQEDSNGGFQDAQNVLDCTHRTSSVKLLDPEPLSSAAPDNTEEENTSTFYQSAEHVPLAPTSHHSALTELQRISVAVSAERTQGCSDVFTYLMVRGLDPQTILGLGSIWMCRGASLKSFFLCESCSEKLQLNDICEHMVGIGHLFNCMWRDYHHLLSLFWWEEDVRQECKELLLKEVAHLLSMRERFNNVDAQCVQLSKELHECVGSAPFSKAIEMLQNIKKEKKLTIVCQPASSPQQKDQQLEDRQRSTQSLPMERQSHQACVTDQRSDGEQGQILDDMVGVQQKRVLCSPDVIFVSSKTDSVVCPLPVASTRLSPQETSGSLNMQPELGPPVLQHQRPIPDRQESPSSSLSPTSQSSPQSASSFTLGDPAATTTLQLPKSLDKGPGPDVQNAFIVKLTELMALVRETQSEINVSSCVSNPHNAEMSASCTNNSSESGVEKRWDLTGVRTSSKIKLPTKGWDLMPLPVEARVNTSPTSIYLSEDSLSNAAHVEVCNEHQLVTHRSNSINSSLENYFLTNAEAKAVGTMLPFVSTADPSDPQHQRSLSAQTVFRNVRQFNPSPSYCEATNHDTSQTPQPLEKTETDSTGVGQFPISSIITPRQDPSNQRFMDNYNGKDLTKVNRGNQAAHMFSTVATACPNNTELAVSGGHAQPSQMAYFSNGYSGYPPSEAVGYTAPGTPPVSSGALHQREGYTAEAFYPSTVHPDQESFSGQSFSHSSATPICPGWMQQQQQPLQQYTQQPYYSNPAAGDGSVTNGASSSYTVPYTFHTPSRPTTHSLANSKSSF